MSFMVLAAQEVIEIHASIFAAAESGSACKEPWVLHNVMSCTKT